MELDSIIKDTLTVSGKILQRGPFRLIKRSSGFVISIRLPFISVQMARVLTKSNSIQILIFIMIPRKSRKLRKNLCHFLKLMTILLLEDNYSFIFLKSILMENQKKLLAKKFNL